MNFCLLIKKNNNKIKVKKKKEIKNQCVTDKYGTR